MGSLPDHKLLVFLRDCKNLFGKEMLEVSVWVELGP